MKRTTVIFLALAILLAHTLAIHQTPSGEFGAPYDMAHVAFRVGRNLVHSGVLIWNPLGEAGEAYPSLLWVLVAAAADALQIYPTSMAQALGIISSLLTIVVLAQFSPKRMVGLSAPVLLACSGAVAAAGSSGTEAATAMLFVTLAFLAYERGWARLLSGSLCLLLITRPEGVIILWLLMLMQLFDRSQDEEDQKNAGWRAFVLPILLVLGSMGMRQWAFGHWLSPIAKAALSFDQARIELGLEYGLSFLTSSGSAPLLALPLLLILSGRLKGRGRRALLLFLGWTGYVMLTGGDGLPFWNALAPTLPLAFLALQRSLVCWLDRYPRQAPLAWCVTIAALFCSLLVSKLPGDMGPIPLERMLKSWMQPSASSVESFPHPLGRQGQLQEIRDMQRLRTTGLFFVGEGKILGDARIATFWPGALGYLSRRTVIDLLGRTTPVGNRTTQSWRGQPKVDLIASLSQPADYLVLDNSVGSTLSISGRFHRWLSKYDLVGDTPERYRQLLATVRHFEVVSVPVPIDSENPKLLSPVPFLLLRSRSLNLAPEITIKRGKRRFKVLIDHHGHRQVADLVVELEDQAGELWQLTPDGSWVQDREVLARSNILIYDTGDRPFEILAGSLPKTFKQGSLQVHLLCSGTSRGGLMELNVKRIEIELQ